MTHCNHRLEIDQEYHTAITYLGIDPNLAKTEDEQLIIQLFRDFQSLDTLIPAKQHFNQCWQCQDSSIYKYKPPNTSNNHQQTYYNQCITKYLPNLKQTLNPSDDLINRTILLCHKLHNWNLCLNHTFDVNGGDHDCTWNPRNEGRCSCENIRIYWCDEDVNWLDYLTTDPQWAFTINSTEPVGSPLYND